MSASFDFAAKFLSNTFTLAQRMVLKASGDPRFEWMGNAIACQHFSADIANASFVVACMGTNFARKKMISEQ